MKKGLNKQRGGALIGVIFVVGLVAAIYFGSSFFLQKELPSEKSLKLLKDAQERIANIDEKNEERNSEIEEELEVETEQEEGEIIEEEIEEEKIEEEKTEETELNDSDLDTSAWQELIRENENFKIKFHKEWYFTVNRREAVQDGLDMIVGFEEDPNIWEKMPPFAVELVIASENLELEHEGYSKTLGSRDGKQYVLRAEKSDLYKELIDEMASTFKFID